MTMNRRRPSRYRSASSRYLAACTLTTVSLAVGCHGGAASSNETVAAGEASSGGHGSAEASPHAAGGHAAELPSQPLDVVATSGDLRAPLPKGVSSFGAAVADGAIYVAGGYFGRPHAYGKAYQARTLWQLTLGEEGAAWQAAGQLETSLQGLELVAHQGRVIQVGGMEIRNEEGQPWDLHSTDSVRAFDPKDGSWSELPSLPAPRSTHGAARIGDRLFVIGGWTLEGGSETGRWREDLLVLDLDSDEPRWERRQSPVRRRGLAVAAAGDRLVAVGGMGDSRNVSSRVDVYDPSADEWTRGPDFPGSAFGVSAVGTNDAVYASGRDGTLYRLSFGDARGSLASASWKPVRTLAFPRFFHRLVDVGEGRVAALGGTSGMNVSDRVRWTELVPLEQGAGEVRVSTMTMANPSAAKNRQGLFLRDGTLYAFGGNNSTGQHDFAPENFLSEGFRIHLSSARAGAMADYPDERQTMQTVVAEGGARGYAVGGFGHDGEAAVTHAEAYAYDFDEDEWNELPGLPRGRSQFGLAEHDGSLWVFGGLNYDPSREGEKAFDHVTNILRATPGQPFEEVEVALPGPRRAFAAATHEGRYVMVGGMREGFQLVDGCKAFRFEEQQFESVACPSEPRLSGELVNLGGTLYLAAGSIRKGEAVEPDPRLMALDLDSGTIRTVLDEIPLPPKHLRMFAYRNRLLMYSAHDAERDVIRFAIVDVGADASTERAASLDDETSSPQARR